MAETVRGGFEATGIARIDAAFSSEEARRMRELIWRFVERKSPVRQQDRGTWPASWLPVSFKNLKKSHAFAPLLESTRVREALDAIFAATGWREPKPGAQILLTFPHAEGSTRPVLWHMDAGFERPTWPVFAVKLFAFFGPVAPGGGGTVLLSGSHRLVERWRAKLGERPRGGNKTSWGRFLRQDPWLAELAGGALPFGAKAEVDGVPLEVVELTGEPGDLVITHLHLFHAGSPNRNDVPRQMLGKTIFAEGFRT